ncbi:TonB-dependent receptor domain-containing protein [Pseudobacter ginsenosidimutans]|uniref:Outer membrane receptor protein involved in Fe transport n=2 Tax=Pseudobacter ginsenosidimutans TaxID=661488 RepID=A0A4Q7MT24_9BACT|nr:TonB-dependent receptor [Pseudobacter ginsenosidimutans]RZS71084.1 outer membrane receptor protein involved in Fe transport [Pseudobacter ginsenosidimutans]
MKYSLLLLSVLWQLSSKAQSSKTTLSGTVRDATQSALPFVNVTLLAVKDSSLVAGTITNEKGMFSIGDITPGKYILRCSYTGFQTTEQAVLIGRLSNFLDLGILTLNPVAAALNEVTVTAKRSAVSAAMDKKTFSLAGNISQAGGSVLDAMRNLPGITSQDGKLQLRGSDKVMVLIDGKQTALTGFGGQASLENIPASAIEKIEIINNPSARYDANGNAGIINIIFKKEKKEGFNGKLGISAGAGALWIKKENYPGIRPQYQATPKINPSLSLNYRKNKTNIFLQADNMYTKTLNKNEFADRFYDNGDTIRQQTKRNRTTNIVTVRTGVDWFKDASNTFTVSGLFSSESIIDRGDEPFFNASLKEQQRLWQFLEDEVKTTATATAIWQHKFAQPGRLLNINFNYTFHREDEKYFFTNIMPSFTGLDSFALLSDEHVADLNLDYIHPLKYGRFETGLKFRRRFIPVNMQFKPGLNSPLDTKAGGRADYSETIPAIYANYVLESNRYELEAGMRAEYVHVEYDVNPDHPVYKSDRYHYLQPFVNLRLGYKIDENNKISLSYNRRVDRPNEVDIRIFPKYDDAEIIKVGNPALRPQFTSNFELGYKTSWQSGNFFAAAYYKHTNATITRIGTVVPGSTIIYNVFQNAGNSYSYGLEFMISQEAAKWATINLNLNGYKNIIDAFSIVNKYPVESIYDAAREDIFSGNIKLNINFHLPYQAEAQLTAIYQAPDLVPQGKTFERFSIDAGVKKQIQQGKGELFLNATDIANTLQLKREIKGNGFRYTSTDYYETQVFRLGYAYKF